MGDFANLNSLDGPKSELASHPKRLDGVYAFHEEAVSMIFILDAIQTRFSCSCVKKRPLID